MYYAKWATKKEVANITSKVNLDKKPEKSGVPIMYDDKYLYTLDKGGHSLVIGSTGSGKTQSTVLPMIKLSAMAGESIVVTDPKGELYTETANIFKDNGYKINVINVNDPDKGNNYNPLDLPYYLYKNGNKDKAMNLIEDLGYYLLADEKEVGDPFWINSSMNYFTGLVLYIFENAKEDEINLTSIVNLSNQVKDDSKFIETVPKDSSIYNYLSGTLCAPPETKGSIISVFAQKINYYATRESLSNMLSKTDIDIKNIFKEKMVVYLIGGSSYADRLIPLVINQIYNVIEIYDNKKTINVILDNFDELLPIRDFYRVLNNSRGYYLRFTLLIKSFMELNNKYGKETTELIKQSVSTIIYLMSTDRETLEEISKICGKMNKNENLIEAEELKHLNFFEAIVITSRMMPIKTKLLPDYQIDYGYKVEKAELPDRKQNNLKTFKI